ncbi:GLPGLI family protein [Polaribacter sp. BAL334]|uniref:GLPGLI family protein n=1 Tax=Polaribacter sp. BAL334 TaxID=1708178 RepID=UPI0018D2418A|nr:GLPGLI family protein [Polaribacter sp. BAL334]MBG7611317.1 GLPGLI family protein [Polaribacter sp. BAL334]
MKIKLIILIIIFLELSVHSQENFYQAKYTMTGKYLNNELYNATLIFNSTKSLYTYRVLSNKDKENVNDDKISLTYSDKNTYYLYSDKIKDSIFDLTNRNKKYFYVTEAIPKLKWRLLKDEKIINKIKCLKATTHFRGKNYIAWYTPSIVTPFGPWKLHGLPGLIMKAYDESEIINFEIIDLKTSSANFKLDLDDKLEKINLISFVKEEKQRIEKLIKVFKSRTEGHASSVISRRDMEDNYYDLEKGLKF